eukprot:COSAG06_NODE_155_length_21876_cov_22.287643_3_plen_186_part_00
MKPRHGSIYAGRATAAAAAAAASSCIVHSGHRSPRLPSQRQTSVVVCRIERVQIVTLSRTRRTQHHRQQATGNRQQQFDISFRRSSGSVATQVLARCHCQMSWYGLSRMIASRGAPCTGPLLSRHLRHSFRTCPSIPGSTIDLATRTQTRSNTSQMQAIHTLWRWQPLHQQQRRPYGLMRERQLS